MQLDKKDRALLRALQRDASRSLQDLADELNMSQSTVWRKLQDFEAAGVVLGRVALVDAAAVDLKVCVIANISLASHSEAATGAFQRLVADCSEIMECHAVSGAYDYMLKVRVRDVEAYETFLTGVLLSNRHVASVSSGFILRQLKYTTALPL